MANFYIPPQMKRRSNFIMWKLETDDKGKQRKIPYSALYNGKASTTNNRTWTTYENALQCQSGNGLHIFAMGTVKKAVKTKEIELYSTGRYAALTSNTINPIDLSEAQQRIDVLYNYCNRGKKETENTRRLPQCVDNSLLWKQ